MCHFQLWEPYAVDAPNVLWYGFFFFVEFPFCITAVSARALIFKNYSQLNRVLWKILMPIHLKCIGMIVSYRKESLVLYFTKHMLFKSNSTHSFSLEMIDRLLGHRRMAALLPAFR